MRLPIPGVNLMMKNFDPRCRRLYFLRPNRQEQQSQFLSEIHRASSHAFWAMGKHRGWFQPKVLPIYHYPRSSEDWHWTWRDRGLRVCERIIAAASLARETILLNLSGCLPLTHANIYQHHLHCMLSLSLSMPKQTRERANEDCLIVTSGLQEVSANVQRWCPTICMWRDVSPQCIDESDVIKGLSFGSPQMIPCSAFFLFSHERGNERNRSTLYWRTFLVQAEIEQKIINHLRVHVDEI